MLNIHTTAMRSRHLADAARFHDGTPYDSVNYMGLWWYLYGVRTCADDVVFDIGSGTGRLLCLLAQRRVKRCVGVEISAQLADRMKQNARRLRGRIAPVEVVVADAAEVEYRDGTIYCLYNPFGSKTFGAVVAAIRRDVERAPRIVRLVYINPAHEYVLADSGWLRCVARRRTWLSRSAASYWTNSPA
jgi:predicted RNA methylase